LSIAVTFRLIQLPTFGVQSPIHSAAPLSAIFLSRLDCSGSFSRRSLDLRTAGEYGSIQ
jgi:hypothetical protein